MKQALPRPTPAFVGASWAALVIGAVVYLSGLWGSSMALNEQGYYFTLLMFGLFAAVSLQKSVRDRMEGIPVTNMYFSLCWVALIMALCLLTIGLWNASLSSSEKGFYAMSFLLSLFGAVAVQKNVRDMALLADSTDTTAAEASPRANGA
ncbi:MAG: hypothetical protein C4K60_11325 [Ideonella sp. MAG2]|nr:MAG: hypothetical protein C4K60_11325 [Ideonella sp. MAG2]